MGQVQHQSRLRAPGWWRTTRSGQGLRRTGDGVGCPQYHTRRRPSHDGNGRRLSRPGCPCLPRISVPVWSLPCQFIMLPTCMSQPIIRRQAAPTHTQMETSNVIVTPSSGKDMDAQRLHATEHHVCLHALSCMPCSRAFDAVHSIGKQ